MSVTVDLNFKKTVTLKDGREVVLRYLKPGDIDAVLKLANELVEEDTFITLTHRFTYEEELDWLTGIVKQLRAGKEVHIGAFDGDTYLGSGNISSEKPRSEHVGIFGIAIAKEVRGVGLGRILMTEAFKQAKEVLGKQLIHFSALANNETALNLYRSMGCIESGRIPQFCTFKGELVDKIIFYKQL